MSPHSHEVGPAALGPEARVSPRHPPGSRLGYAWRLSRPFKAPIALAGGRSRFPGSDDLKLDFVVRPSASTTEQRPHYCDLTVRDDLCDLHINHKGGIDTVLLEADAVKMKYDIPLRENAVEKIVFLPFAISALGVCSRKAKEWITLVVNWCHHSAPENAHAVGSLVRARIAVALMNSNFKIHLAVHSVVMKRYSQTLAARKSAT